MTGWTIRLGPLGFVCSEVITKCFLADCSWSCWSPSAIILRDWIDQTNGQIEYISLEIVPGMDECTRLFTHSIRYGCAMGTRNLTSWTPFEGIHCNIAWLAVQF